MKIHTRKARVKADPGTKSDPVVQSGMTGAGILGTPNTPNGQGTQGGTVQVDPMNLASLGVGAYGYIPEKIEFNPMIQLGRSGLRQYGGFVTEDFLTNLRNPRGAQSYKEMVDNSALIGGILRLIDLSLRQVSRYVEPFSDAAEDEERAERVNDSLDDLSHTWEDTLSEILTMLPYGYAPMEIVWKKCEGFVDDPTRRSKFDDGYIMPRKIELRSQDTLFRWAFDPDGGVRAMIQLPPPDYVMRTIPIEKLLLFRPKVEKGNPEGMSVLRSSYFNWQMIKRLTEFESITAERWAIGLPVAYIPARNMMPGATAAETSVFTAVKKVVQNIRVDDQMGVVFPQAFDPITKQPLFKLELLGQGGNGSSAFDYDKPITRHEVRIAISLLSDIAMMGSTKVGSFALSKTKSVMFEAGLTAWLDSIYGVLNRHLIPRIYQMNGWPTDRLCTLGHGKIRSEDSVAISEAAKNLAAAGMALFPDDTLENQIREDLGWPEKPEDLEMMQQDMQIEQQQRFMDEGFGPDGGMPQPDPEAEETNGKDRKKKPRPDQKKRVTKAAFQPRNRRGAFHPISADHVTALNVLRDRQRIGPGDQIAHGFTSIDQPPYDTKRSWAQAIDEAPVARMNTKDLIATQPSVRRDGIRNFLMNPGIVLPGQRNLSGELEDRPVVILAGEKFYIHDGHHRLAARRLLGYTDALVRMIEAPVAAPAPSAPSERIQSADVRKTPPWHIVERDGKFLVVGSENGKTYGEHDSRDKALAHMRALYANVPDARKGQESDQNKEQEF